MKRSLLSSANATGHLSLVFHPLGRVHADSLEERGDCEPVELGAVLDNLDRGLQVVEEAVDVGEEDGDVGAGAEEVGKLQGGDEVCGSGVSDAKLPWEVLVSTYIQYGDDQ
jgi:hypothetical protein